MSNNQLVKIGHVAKTHGLNGCFSIKLHLSKKLNSLCSNIKKIYLIDQPNALDITSIVLQKNTFLKIQVNNIKSREIAKSILKQNIYIKTGDYQELDQHIYQENELVNFTIIDKKIGKIGFIQKIDFNRFQPLISVSANHKTILIPFVEDFIIKTDHKKYKIHMDLPDGLIELCCES